PLTAPATLVASFSLPAPPLRGVSLLTTGPPWPRGLGVQSSAPLKLPAMRVSLTVTAQVAAHLQRSSSTPPPRPMARLPTRGAVTAALRSQKVDKRSFSTPQRRVMAFLLIVVQPPPGDLAAIRFLTTVHLPATAALQTMAVLPAVQLLSAVVPHSSSAPPPQLMAPLLTMLLLPAVQKAELQDSDWNFLIFSRAPGRAPLSTMVPPLAVLSVVRQSLTTPRPLTLQR